MRQAVSRRRFRTVITREGTIIVPDAARRGLKAGQSVWVEVEPFAGSAGHRAPDEEEVAAIAALQAEHPDVIRRCLRAQGTLSRRAGRPARHRGGRG
jgi:bifunctional DNA-binding transcriptional regulator/antitoxin component of YhaV-PrlF toxin-antitoxin module